MKKKFDIPKMGDVLDDCLSCIFHNSNGTCGNTRSIMFGVATNHVMTGVTTPEKPILNQKGNVK